ncbi:uncharacterized protein ATNIH1004_005204 [Aspergillus tanneri]|uniref:Uncharacterized protein n=1 Tax=Aspergillus tanneri TaxID=1220188 RepID=A0A5M9MWN7_9EURO|nr:uncharacterized protein ATNIH1004_005204 [Aspergillus tanneri]KAA8649303.1 hypothetical protein ATNIH1004_005204 [Aspergillus tanneri]
MKLQWEDLRLELSSWDEVAPSLSNVTASDTHLSTRGYHVTSSANTIRADEHLKKGLTASFTNNECKEEGAVTGPYGQGLLQSFHRRKTDHPNPELAGVLSSNLPHHDDALNGSSDTPFSEGAEGLNNLSRFWVAQLERGGQLSCSIRKGDNSEKESIALDQISPAVEGIISRTETGNMEDENCDSSVSDNKHPRKISSDTYNRPRLVTPYANYRHASESTVVNPTSIRNSPSLDNENEDFSRCFGRNSIFSGLSDQECRKLGGVEYRAVYLLTIIVPMYFLLWQVLGGVTIAAYVASYKSPMASIPGGPGSFCGIKANSGLSLVDANMILHIYAHTYGHCNSIYDKGTKAIRHMPGKTAPWKDTKPSIGPHFTMHYTAPPAPVQLLFQSLLVSPTPPRICYSHAPETGTKRKWATEIIPPSGP